MSINLEMTSDRDGETESGRTVPAGTKVQYVAHVLGGCVRVRLPDGTTEVMNPNCFQHLREE